jgi:hypothetical protein
LSKAESVSWGMSLVTKCSLKSSHISVQHLLTQSWLGISVVVTDPHKWEFLYTQLCKYISIQLYDVDRKFGTHIPKAIQTPPPPLESMKLL